MGALRMVDVEALHYETFDFTPLAPSNRIEEGFVRLFDDMRLIGMVHRSIEYQCTVKAFHK